ncbi:MAG: sigma-70 family RNA polymerase sigma factor [Planctomycetales bacterium]|nr:sigma-70 family RNA polymerase sigma factor [Planctomycetales bacterium]
MQSNSEIVRAVVDHNDQDAFARIVARYERLVWTVAWAELHDHHATQDVTQETFLIAHKRLSDLHDPDSLGFWLSKIARREATRFRKRKSVTRSIDGFDAPDDRSPAVAPIDQHLLEAVAKLPEHERIVTVLRFISGHTVAEVAELTGRPVGTVTKQLSRALGRLKASLQVASTETKTSFNNSGASHVEY